jgi:hypothetical protein
MTVTDRPHGSLRRIAGAERAAEHNKRRKRKAEDSIDRAHPDLAITRSELVALRRHLGEQTSKAEQTFWQNLRNEQQKMEEREQERAERRRKIEKSHAEYLLEVRKRIRKINWANRDFEAEAARKLHAQNHRRLDRQFGPEAFLDRLVPPLCNFASNVAMFEHGVLAGLPLSQRQRHMRRVVAGILEIIFQRVPAQAPLPPEAKRVRASDEKKRAGEVIAGPFEILHDSRGRLVGWRRALYAERHGEFEHLPIGNLWGLLRAMGKERLRLRRMVKARLVSDLVQMAEDQRSRKQMAKDCGERHGIADKNIIEAARVSRGDFYKWRADNPGIGAEKNRRILLVVCSPVWPPPNI